MKKITALILTLVLALSLLPIGVWATEVASGTDVPRQLYAGFFDGNTTIWNTFVNCPSGEQRGFYLGVEDNGIYTIITADMIGSDKEYSLSDSGNVGTVSTPDQYNWCAWQPVGAAAQGYIQLTHNANGTVYRLPVEISYPPLYMYGQGQNGEYNYFNGTGFPVGGVQEFALSIWAPVAENEPWEYVKITQTDGYLLGCSDEILNGCITWSTAAGKENVAIINTQGITLNEQKVVYLTATKDGATYGLRINLHPSNNQGGSGNNPGNDAGYPTFGNMQLYFSASDQGEPVQRKMSVNAGTAESFYLWYNRDGAFRMITQDDSPAFSVPNNDIGTFSIGADNKVTWNTADIGANRQAVLNVTVDGTTYRALLYTTASAENRVPDPDREDMDVDLTNASFKYKGTEYYLVPVYPSGNGVTRLLGSTFTIDRNRTYFWSYTAALATTKNGTDFTLVYDEEILGLLEDIEFSLTALDREWITANGKSMPLCLQGDAFSDWGHREQYTKLTTYNKFCDPIGLVFDFSSAGPYKLTVSATVNGKAITSSACTTAFYKETYVIDSLTTVDAINTKLAQFKTEHPEADKINDEIMVVLPSGELEGIIQIPSALPDVFFNGSENGETVLKGGIHAENQITEVRNIRFVGAGKDKATLDDGITPNYGLWGKAFGGFFNCTFSNYDCAVVSSHGVRFGGMNSIFYNNRVALWMNVDPASKQGGNLDMNRMVFAHNDVAMQLDQFTSTLDLGIYITAQNIFYENGKDAALANSKRSFFMPGNVYDENNGVQRNFKGNVYGDPYYVLSELGRSDLRAENIGNLPLGTYNENWITSVAGKFVKVFPTNWKVPMVYANADDYVIPANELKNGKMIIDVVDNTADGTNDVVATITLKPASEKD